MVYRIRGRIETVNLIDIVRPDLFSGQIYGGEINGEKVLVNTKKDYKGKKCLMRFGLSQKGEKPIGNFITSNVPSDFLSLDYDKYILIGIWEDRVRVIGEYPNLQDIDDYYDPGDMPVVVYIKNTDKKKSKKYLGAIITPNLNYFREFRSNFNYLILKGIQNPYKTTLLQNPNKGCRIIIAQPSDRIGDLEQKIKDIGLVPIRMEPLR